MLHFFFFVLIGIGSEKKKPINHIGLIGFGLDSDYFTSVHN